MIPPFPLYVDEISPDNIKATVSNPGTVVYNLRTISLDTPDPAVLFGGYEINGVSVVPAGRFICMLVQNNRGKGMIILDLIGKEEIAWKMAEKLDHVDLRDKFMQVYAEVAGHPEKHRRFQLVIGKAEVIGWF
jgi:hypothetical protein